MQQTDKYKLNLVEKDDVFSPDPLNENMEKVEGALEAARAETAALDQRLQVFEAHHVAIGYYTPAKTAQDINLGFAPRAVLVLPNSNDLYVGISLSDAPRNDVLLTDTGIHILPEAGSYNSAILNRSGVKFGYLALG